MARRRPSADADRVRKPVDGERGADDRGRDVAYRGTGWRCADFGSVVRVAMQGERDPPPLTWDVVASTFAGRPVVRRAVFTEVFCLGCRVGRWLAVDRRTEQVAPQERVQLQWLARQGIPGRRIMRERYP